MDSFESFGFGAICIYTSGYFLSKGINLRSISINLSLIYFICSLDYFICSLDFASIFSSRLSIRFSKRNSNLSDNSWIVVSFYPLFLSLGNSYEFLLLLGSSSNRWWEGTCSIFCLHSPFLLIASLGGKIWEEL